MWDVANIKTFQDGRYLKQPFPVHGRYVYVGRGGKGLEGSPLRNRAVYPTTDSRYPDVIYTEDPIGWYETWLTSEMKKGRGEAYTEIVRLANSPDGVLLCWCSPDPCHADVIANIIENYRAGKYDAHRDVPTNVKYFGKTLLHCPVEMFYRMGLVKHPISSLYALGNVELLNHPHILACIGTRQPSDGAVKLYSRAIEHAIEGRFILTSGFARGSDIIATELALRYNQPTIVCMPSGFEYVYPEKHKYLVEKILATDGLIITEYQPDDTINRGDIFRKEYLRDRNRLIVAPASGVLVCEAQEQSGTMHAIRKALELGRPVALSGRYGAYTPPINHVSLSVRDNVHLLSTKEDLTNFFDAATRKSLELDRARYLNL